MDYDWLMDEHEVDVTADCGCRMWRDGGMVKLKYCSVHEAVTKDATEDAGARVMFYGVGRPMEIRNMPSKLEVWQEAVGGGLVEQTPVFTRPGLYVMLNEEGKLKRMPMNRPGHPFGHDDIFVGPFFVTRISDDGDTMPLTDEDIAWLRANTP